MGCFHPLTAYKSLTKKDNGKSNISFKKLVGHVSTAIQLPCGQCTGCRLERSRQWAIRCQHETSMHEDNCFITLTYDNKNLPADGSLDKIHYQKFMKRLRKKFPSQKIRFYHCGEYGDQLGRPHYHALLFGFDFKDKTYHKKTKIGDILYTSEILDKLWGKGHCYIGSATFESAAYVARYIMKKINGEQKFDHYNEIDESTGEIICSLEPEYTTMSRRPGIGKKWWDKYKQDVYPSEEVIIKKGGKNIAIPPPKYYENQYEIDNPVQHQQMKQRREKAAKENASENTPERLLVKETIANKRLNQLPRELHEN